METESEDNYIVSWPIIVTNLKLILFVRNFTEQ